MDSRREVILAFLKTHGPATLAEIAAHLEVSKQGALRHLEVLEGSGLAGWRSATATAPSRTSPPAPGCRASTSSRCMSGFSEPTWLERPGWLKRTMTALT